MHKLRNCWSRIAGFTRLNIRDLLFVPALMVSLIRLCLRLQLRLCYTAFPSVRQSVQGPNKRSKSAGELTNLSEPFLADSSGWWSQIFKGLHKIICDFAKIDGIIVVRNRLFDAINSFDIYRSRQLSH